MSWRTVVVSKSAKLDYSMGYVVIRDVVETVKVHLSEIAILIIENTSTSVTTALLSELTAKKIKVIFCDAKRNPSSELVSFYGSHDSSQKIKKQILWKKSAKEFAWTAIVAEKIKNQSEVLKQFNIEQYKLLDGYLEELEYYDATNREGHAAKVYFNALFGKDFYRSDENPLNACLNYGYSLILSAFNREVVCNGYLTQLGLFHDNQFNFYNLSCDLMEPFRPFIDFTTKKNNPTKFEREEKMQMVYLLSEEIVIDERRNTLLNGVKIYVKSVFDAIEEEDISLIKFPVFNYEL